MTAGHCLFGFGEQSPQTIELPADDEKNSRRVYLGVQPLAEQEQSSTGEKQTYAHVSKATYTVSAQVDVAFLLLDSDLVSDDEALLAKIRVIDALYTDGESIVTRGYGVRAEGAEPDKCNPKPGEGLEGIRMRVPGHVTIPNAADQLKWEYALDFTTHLVQIPAVTRSGDSGGSWISDKSEAVIALTRTAGYSTRVKTSSTFKGEVASVGLRTTAVLPVLKQFVEDNNLGEYEDLKALVQEVPVADGADER